MTSLERLRQVMVRPVSSFWKEGADVNDVEALLAQARRDAKNSGRSVDEVLASYGFELREDGSVRVAEQAPETPGAEESAPPTASDAPILAALAPRCEDEAQSLL